MRIGLYNLYWTTLGGGERYAASMAHALSKVAKVELLSNESIDVDALGSHLGIDLSRVSARSVGHGGSPALQQASGEYDLFINSCFNTDLPSSAARSVLIVMFPQQFTRAVRARLAGIVGSAMAPRSMVAPFDGFFPVRPGGLAWTRSRAVLEIDPRALRQGRLRLSASPARGRTLEETIESVTGSNLDWRIDGEALVLEARVRPTGPTRVEILSRVPEAVELGQAEPAGIGLDLNWNDTRGHSLRRRIADRAAREVRTSRREFLDTYDLHLAISEYTRTWIHRRWGIDSTILHPPIDLESFRQPPDEPKEDYILAVGRFFAGAHNKKHLEMLKVFRRLCDERRIPEDWELHLVGNVHRNSLADLEYYADVHRLSEGYPVKILPQLSFEQLQREYRRASIFWHATGLGVNEHRRPEKQEHFGMTTCEAMSARCIPIVIARAGQLEVLEDGETGFHFSTRRQLAEITARVANASAEPWVEAMRTRAAGAVERFGQEAFDRRLLALLEEHGLLS